MEPLGELSPIDCVEMGGELRVDEVTCIIPERNILYTASATIRGKNPNNPPIDMIKLENTLYPAATPFDQEVRVKVIDPYSNMDPNLRDTVWLYVGVDRFSAIETDVNSGIFEGLVPEQEKPQRGKDVLCSCLCIIPITNNLISSPLLHALGIQYLHRTYLQ